MATPTLSGWVYDPYQQADKMLAYFTTCEPANNPIAHRQMRSLHDITMRYQTEPARLAQEIEDALSHIFRQRWSSSVVKVRESLDPEGGALYDINISITFTEGNNKYDVRDAIRIENGTIKAIESYNRSGLIKN